MNNCCNCMGYHEQSLDWLMEEMRRVINEWAEVKKENEDFTTDINGKIVILEKDFADLKTYVDNYFANLDVQDEINTKLDEMLNNGEFDAILQKFFLNEHINVLDPPDNLNKLDSTGVVDCSRNLQSIINYCAGKGGEIFFPKGRYKFDESITITETGGITFKGESIGSVTFIVNAETLFNMGTAEKSKNFTRFENIIFTNSFESGDCTYLNLINTTAFRCELCYFYNSAHPIIITKGSGARVLNSNIINDTFEGAGIGIQINGALNSSYIQNVAINAGKASYKGILVSAHSRDCFIDSLETFSCTTAIEINGTGSDTNYPGNIQITGCILDSCKNRGILFTNMNSINPSQILNNYISRSSSETGFVGINLSSASNVNVVGNTIINFDPTNCVGLTVGNSIIVNNNIITNVYRAILLNGDDSIILGNVIKLLDQSQFVSGTGIRNSIVSNNVKGNVAYMLNLSNSDYLIIANNLLSKGTGAGTKTDYGTNSIFVNNIEI